MYEQWMKNNDWTMNEWKVRGNIIHVSSDDTS